MKISSVVALFVFMSVAHTYRQFELLIVNYGSDINYVPITKHKEHNELYAGNSTFVDPLGDIVRFTLNDDGTLQNEVGVKVSVIDSDDYPQFGLTLDKDNEPTHGFSISDGRLTYHGKTGFSACPFFARNKYENYLSIDLKCSAGTIISLRAVEDIHTATTSTPSPTLLPVSDNYFIAFIRVSFIYAIYSLLRSTNF